jgi:hypothetical protein
MKSICIVICALTTSSLVASAQSIEQVLNVSVTGGVYQGAPTTSPVNPAVEIDPVKTFTITSPILVRALAIDSGTNYSNFVSGTLFYKTSLDGSITNVVIRRVGKTNELNVTTNFVFIPGPFVVTQSANTNTALNPSLLKTNRVETGLMSLSFNSSNASFTAFGFAYGTSSRSINAVVGKVNGTNASGYANLLSFSGGSGIASVNTNLFTRASSPDVGTNLVAGPAQIQITTSAPVVSPSDPTSP